MKPKRIILIRHGESEGNTDWSVYENIQNHNIKLTSNGIEQAILAGRELKKIIGKETIHFYISPYIRTRQTYKGLLKNLDKNSSFLIEEPRLREQDTGHYREKDLYIKNRKYMENFGKFYYRFPEGESGADVYDRVSTFLETLHRDFRKKNFSQNVVIVTHGLTMRLFLMRWFHLKVEEYENTTNPKNCEFIVMTKMRNNKFQISGGTYKLNQEIY